eukprot:scaffold4622_cov368-Prasinococcus_capsulatus_cf.AAC.3
MACPRMRQLRDTSCRGDGMSEPSSASRSFYTGHQHLRPPMRPTKAGSSTLAGLDAGRAAPPRLTRRWASSAIHVHKLGDDGALQLRGL